MPIHKHKITIAIDGYSSCGKSTLARDLARRLSYVYVDSGAMYRAVTLHLLRESISPLDEDRVKLEIPKIHLSFQIVDGINCIFMNGENVADEIRSMKVNQLVSPVAAISSVRKAMVAQQRLMGSEKGIVMDGRDIGTVVFPKAELKLFITASIEVRTERRWLELQNRGFDIGREEVEKNIIERDHIDTSRADSPLAKADDAIEIDNSFLDRRQQLDAAYDLARSTIYRVSQT